MADETSVGGIVAPVRADITDFMSKFDAVNEKTNIVSNNIVAKLDEINKAMQNLNSQSVGANVSKHDKSVDETASRYKSLRQEVNQASVEMEKAWRGNGASFNSAKKNYEDALNKLVAFKKESGTISIGQESGIYSSMARGVDKTSASYDVLINRIKDLKNEQKEFGNITSIATPKASQPVVGNIAEMIKASQITDSIKESKYQIAAIDRNLFEELRKNNQNETIRTGELRRQKSEIEGQLSALKSQRDISPDKTNIQRERALQEEQKIRRAIDTSAQKAQDATDKAQRAEIARLETMAQKYDALNNRVRNYQESDVQMSRLQFNRMQEQAKMYENIMNTNNMRNNTGTSPLLGRSYEEYYRARVGLDALTAAQEKYGIAVGGNNRVLASFRGHLTWMAGAVAIGAILSIPIDTVTRLKEIEQGMAGVKQVLPSLEHDQAASNKEAREFIAIASLYGESVDKVIDAGRSWGRMYKEVDTVNLLVSQSAKMAVADNFDMALSVKGLESAMAQFGMKSENYNEIMLNSSRILDVWTKLAHTGAASAQDLTAATERAGASANQMGVSFEFFNALVSTGVRNTALSGENIGNSLKSMFNSIHSKKAISEIENLGVAIYKVNADGTRSFRDTQSVILDLALAIKSTNKDTSALELALGGGKFQVSKITSIMTDYKEILKMWENAVNSAGFTDQQVGVQMDTLARKSKTMKAEMDNIFTSAGDSGLTKNLKDMTESMTNFIRGMDKGAESITFLIKWSALAGIPLYALAKALQGVAYYNGFVEMSTMKATGATAQGMVADIEATVAKTGLSAALLNQSRAAGMVAATTGVVTRSTAMVTAATMGWVGIAIVLAGVIYNVVTAIGEHSRAVEKNNDTIDKRQEKAVGQLARSKEQAEFITTLSARYVSLGVEIDKNSGSTEENTKKVEQQNTILAALSRQSGLTTDELVVDGVLQVEAIENATKAKKQQAKESIQADIDKTVADINATNESIKATETRIENMKTEMKSVSLLGKAYQWLMSTIAEGKIKQADELDKVANGNGDIGYYLYGKMVDKDQMKADATTLREGADSYLDKSGQAGIDILLGQVEGLKGTLAPQMAGINKLQESLIAMDKEIEKNPNVLPEGKDKNNTEPGADNKEQQFNDKALSRSVNQMFDEAKISADKYSMALDIVNAKESLMGVSADSSKQRQILMKEQVNDLLATAMEYSGLATDYERQANDMVANNEAMVGSLNEQKVSWSGLNKEQKLAFIELNKDYIRDINSMNNLVDLADKLRVKSADLSKQASNTSLNALQKSISDARTIYNDKMSLLDLNKQNKQLDLGNHYTKEQLDTIELSSAIDKLREAKVRLEELEKQPGGKGSIEYNQQLVAVKQLTNQVGILSDKTVVVNTNMANMFIGMKNGTTSFKEFWRNAWSDMADEAIKNIWNVNQAGSQTSFLGGLFSSIFGGGGNVANTGQFTSNNQILSGPVMSDGSFTTIAGKRENGGPVIAGKPYIVGEKRPELFVPDSNGTIIPNLNSLRSGNSNSTDMGGGNTKTEMIVNVEQNFNGKQDSSVMAQIKESIPYIKAEIRNSMANEQSMRSAVKGAAK